VDTPETREGAGGAARARSGTAARLLPIGVLAVATVAGAWLVRDLDVFHQLQEHRAAAVAWVTANPVAAALAFVAGHLAVVLLSLPGGFALTVAGGFLFGLVAATALSVASATVGALGVFLAVRFGVGSHARAWMGARGSGGMFGRIERGLARDPVMYLLLLRLVPAVPFQIANIVPAFFSVSARTFALTTFVGLVPGTAVSAWIGVGLGEVLARGEPLSAAALMEPHLYLPIAACVLLALLPLLARRLLL
jgi:uncharacterized membrane protein YdjX (TVP38/TMEM64 family)